MSEPKFKFQVGDVVRHATYGHMNAFAREAALPAIILVRSWHEELGGFFYATYLIDSAFGTESGVSEFVLELVELAPETPKPTLMLGQE